MHATEGTQTYGELSNLINEFVNSAIEISPELEARLLMNDYSAYNTDFNGRYSEDVAAFGNAYIKQTEFNADVVGTLLGDEAFIQRLAARNKGLLTRLFTYVKSSFNNTQSREAKRYLNKVYKAFANALDASHGGVRISSMLDEEEKKSSAEKTAENVEATNNERMSIVVLEDGNTYVTASRKIITGNDMALWRKQITEFFNTLLEKNNRLDITAINGDVLTITKAETADKARDNYKKSNGQSTKMSTEEFKVKLNAEAHIDEIVQTSFPQKNNVSDTKNHSFAKDGFSYRTAYFEDFDGQYYKITLSIGHSGSVATVYNVGKIKENSIPSATKIIAVVGSQPRGMLSNDSISENSENVNSFSENNFDERNSLSDDVESEVLAHYGKTYNWRETGYIFKDGTRLDLSGRTEGAPGGYRSVDHREIFSIEEFENGDTYGNEALVEFMKRGNIRVMPETPGINLILEPTDAQYEKIADMVEKLAWKEKYFSVDFDNSNGNTVDNLTYEGNVSAKKAIADIKYYFKEGKLPYKSEFADFRYSFTNSSSGMANDLLLQYDDELREVIFNRGDYIIDSFEKLTDFVNIAFEEPKKKATAYFGIIDKDVLKRITENIPNLPKELNGVLFKEGKDYSISATLDSVRHMVDEKNLSRSDVIDYLDRFADTIVDFDSVAFNYYNRGNNKLSGLLFKKSFSDGVLINFDLISRKKRSLELQSLSLDKVSYEKKKSAETLLMQNAHSKTSKTQVGQTSANSIPPNSNDVNISDKNNFDERHSVSESAANSEAPRTRVRTEVETEKPDAWEKTKSFWTNFQVHMSNSQAGIEKAGKKLGIDNISAITNYVRAAYNAAGGVLADAQFDINFNKVGESLKSIFEPVRKKGQKYTEDFMTYLACMHHIDRIAEYETAQERMRDIEQNEEISRIINDTEFFIKNKLLLHILFCDAIIV